MTPSEPTLAKFDPTIIPFQYDVIRWIRKGVDYKGGIAEALLSGSVGSSKTTLMAHLVCTHCLMFPGACVLLGRRTLADLKATLLAKILEHLEDLEPFSDYVYNKSTSGIKFRNGSQIISKSWADGKIMNVRSYEFSAAAIEELVENDDLEFYHEIKMRVGRIAKIPESWVISATNPGSPAHDAYSYFIEQDGDYRKTFYSVTDDNPFLPPAYVTSLKKNLDPKMARRMLHGEWIDLHEEKIYYAYSRSKNYRDISYEINAKYPVIVSFDFNIALGKPLSVVLMQFIDDELHIFGEIVVEGMRTLDAMDEAAERGIFNLGAKIYIHADATGKNRDTRNVKSDIDQIRSWLDHYQPKHGTLEYEIVVPLSNPAVRKRWALVNAYCENLEGQNRLCCYRDAPTADKGLRLTALKPGGRTTEDDTKSYQHITTAIGYGLWAQKHLPKPQKTVLL
jgi:hypothetical protein